MKRDKKKSALTCIATKEPLFWTIYELSEIKSERNCFSTQTTQILAGSGSLNTETMWSQLWGHYMCHTICGQNAEVIQLSVEIKLFGQHRDNTGNLLLLTVAWVFGPGLKVSCYHVINTCEDLQDFQLLAVLTEDVTKSLNKPRAPAWIPPWVVTWMRNAPMYKISVRCTYT